MYSKRMFIFLLLKLMQVCQLQGNGIGVSTARAQAERAAETEATEEGTVCSVRIICMKTGLLLASFSSLHCAALKLLN